jgi:hypothetical protein
MKTLVWKPEGNKSVVRPKNRWRLPLNWILKEQDIKSFTGVS